MNGTACSRLCSDFGLPFAGVIYRQYCLCASDQDFAALDPGRRVTKIDSQECDVTPNIRFYGPAKGDRTAGSVPEAKITASSERAAVDESVVFDVSVVESGKLDGLEYQVDFDDGSILSPWSDKKRVDHTFRIPGHFVVKVHVRQAKQPDRLIAGASTVVSIGQKFEESEVNFTCRQLIEPGDGSGCNITLYAGQDLLLDVDFGDGSEPFIFNASGE